MRRAIAQRMTESKQRAPHFYLETEIETNAAAAYVERLNARSEVRVTMTALLVRASALALREHPALNAVWTERGLERIHAAHVGVAIELDDGLVAPAVLNANACDVADTATRLRDLVARARAGKLRGPEMTDATFTCSNLGMFPISRFIAIVTPPQVAILATGRSETLPRYVDGELRPTGVMNATVSADHRAVDGADVARFLATLKALVERPDGLDG